MASRCRCSSPATTYVQSRMGAKLHSPTAVASHYGVSDSSYALYKHVFDGFFARDRRNTLPQNSQPGAGGGHDHPACAAGLATGVCDRAFPSRICRTYMVPWLPHVG